MRKLSPLKAVSHALNSVWNYRAVALRIGMVWVPVMLVGGPVSSTLPRRRPTAHRQEMTPQTLVQVVTGIISIIAVCSMAVSWHRFILRDEPAAGLRLDGDVFRYAGNTILIMLAMLVPALIFVTVMVFAAPLGRSPRHCRSSCWPAASSRGRRSSFRRWRSATRASASATRGRRARAISGPVSASSCSMAAILLGILLVLTVVAGFLAQINEALFAGVPVDGRIGAAAVLCGLQRVDLHLPLRLLRRAARFLTGVWFD